MVKNVTWLFAVLLAAGIGFIAGAAVVFRQEAAATAPCQPTLEELKKRVEELERRQDAGVDTFLRIIDDLDERIDSLSPQDEGSKEDEDITSSTWWDKIS